QNSSNLTPLYLAIQNGHEEVCEYLISIGANIHLLVDNKNALAYALKNKQLKCIELTLERTNFIFNNQYDMGNFLLMCKLGLWEFCEKIIAKFPQLAITPLEDRHKSFDEVVCYLDYICKNNEYLIFADLLKRKEVNSIGYLWDNIQSIYRIAIRYGSKEILAKLNTLGIVNPFNYNSQIFINQGSQFMPFKSYDLIQLAVKQNIPLIYNKYLEIDNIDIEHSTIDGKNLIYLAAESGNQKLVEKLIEKGAKLVAPNGKHIFYALTLNNHCHIIRHLVLRYQFDINAVIDEEYKLRTIDLACKQGNIETIVALIGYGASIDVPNSNKYLPVYYAIENKAPQVIRLIFKYELGNLVDILSFAIKSHHNEILGEILKNRPNYKGEILKFGLELMQVAIESRNLKVFKLLVEIGINPNNEFLHLAIRKGYHEIVSLLIANGVDVNYQDEEGNTAFNLAIQLGKNLCLNELLKINNLNQSIKNEGIALEERNLWIKHIISNNQSEKINSELIASIKAADIDKFTQVLNRYAIPVNWSINYEYKAEKIVGSLLDVAILEYQPPIIEYLLSQSELNPYEINSLGLTAVHLLMKNVDATYTIKLIENFKLDLNIINPNNGCNLLHFAVLTKNNAMIDYLINKQVDIHAEMSDGQTIMHLAIQQKSFDLVKKLIEHHGYSIHHKNSQQESCLAVALKNGNLVIAEYLVNMGANIFERDGFKERTMLHYAVMSEDINVVFFVLTCGVDTRTCDNMKMLPIHLAAKQGNTSIIELLSEQDSLLLTPTDIRNRDVKDFALIHKKIDTTTYLTKKYGVVNKKSVTEDKEINFKKYRFGDKTQLELAIIAEDQFTIASLIDSLPENDLETIKKAIAIAGGCANFNIFVYILNRLWDGENKQVLRSCMMAAIANNRIANVRELLNLIGSEIVFDDGNTPLKLAAECDSLEIFKEVYQYNKDYFVQMSSQEIYSILQNIIKNNNLTMAKILGENYSDDIMNFTDANGNTLLHHAVLNNKPNMLAYFMMNGWVDKNNHANMSALDIATKKKYSECVKYLSVVNNNSGVIKEINNMQANSSPLTNAYKTNNREIFKWLLEQGFNPYLVSFKSNNLKAESRKDMAKIYKDWYEDQIDEILKLLNYNLDFKNVDTFINMFDLLLVKLAEKCNLSKDMNHNSWNQLFIFMEIGLEKLNSMPKMALNFPKQMVNKIKNTYANREYFSIIEKILDSQYFLRLVKKLTKLNQNKNPELPNARCGGGLI
nr:ankyrin repeat domain-containing protein [Burkholderiales bacterium]